MKRVRWLAAALLSAVGAASVQAQSYGAGVPLSLAQERAQRVHDLRYDVRLDIPAAKTTRIAGDETIAFTLSDATTPLLLDFAADQKDILDVSVAFTTTNGH